MRPIWGVASANKWNVNARDLHEWSRTDTGHRVPPATAWIPFLHVRAFVEQVPVLLRVPIRVPMWTVLV